MADRLEYLLCYPGMLGRVAFVSLTNSYRPSAVAVLYTSRNQLRLERHVVWLAESIDSTKSIETKFVMGIRAYIGAAIRTLAFPLSTTERAS